MNKYKDNIKNKRIEKQNKPNNRNQYGKSGIRTHGIFKYISLANQRNKPLCHLPTKIILLRYTISYFAPRDTIIIEQNNNKNNIKFKCKPICDQILIVNKITNKVTNIINR